MNRNNNNNNGVSEDILLTTALILSISKNPRNTYYFLDALKGALDINGLYRNCGNMFRDAFKTKNSSEIGQRIIEWQKDMSILFVAPNAGANQIVNRIYNSEYERPNTFASAFWRSAFRYIRSITMFIAYDVSQIDTIIGSGDLNKTGQKDYFGPVKVYPFPPKGAISYLNFENNSCFCDTLFQYMFGFTDLFDFMFRGVGTHKQEYPQIPNSFNLQAILDDPNNDEFFLRFIAAPVEAKNVLQRIHMSCPATAYMEDIITGLLTICNYVRTGSGQYMASRWLIRNITKKAIDSYKSPGNDLDYGEFYSFILRSTGISQYVIPKALMTLYYIRRGKRFKFLTFLVHTDTPQFLFRKLNMIRENTFMASDPSSCFNFESMIDSSLDAFLTECAIKPELDSISNDTFEWADDFRRIEDFMGRQGSFVAEFKLANLPSIFFVNLNPIGDLDQRNRFTPFPTDVARDHAFFDSEVIVNSVQGKEAYYITCLVFHKGFQGGGGHYTMLAKHPKTKLWYLYNDVDAPSMQEHPERYQFKMEDLAKMLAYKRTRVGKGDRTRIYTPWQLILVEEVVSKIREKVVGIWYTKKSVFDAYQI